MRLIQIDITNFRQYIDQNTIEFSQDSKKNVTIIHGENGSGKTTLLQAILWCLYGKYNLPKGEQMINTKVASLKGENFVEVTLVFKHHSQTYEVTRTQAFLGDKKSGHSKLNVSYKTENGISKTFDEGKESAQMQINRIIPDDLSHYFFFDGERIKYLGENDSSKRKKDLSQAVTSVLGLDVLYKIRKHLGDKKKVTGVRQEFTSMFNDQSDTELKDVNTELDIAQKKIENIEFELSDYEKQIEILLDEKEPLVESLKTNKRSKDMQLRKENLEKENEKLNTTLTSKSKKMFELSSSGLAPYLSIKMFNDAKSILSQFETSEESITGLRAETIDSLLDRGICICGNDLRNNQDAIDLLRKLKEDLPNSDHSMNVNNFFAAADRHHKDGVKFEKDFKDQYREYMQYEKTVGENYDEILELSSFIKNIPELSKVEKRVEDIDLEIKELNRKEIVGNVNREKFEKEFEKLEEKRKKISEKSSLNRDIQYRIDFVDQLNELLDRYLDKEEGKIRDILNDRVGRIFNNILHKKYSIIIDEDYKFDVRDSNGISIGTSEGESQVTSLSFICGILEIGKKRLLKSELIDDELEVYPLIMDSPFGTLDSIHRRNIAHQLPKLSEQTIIFVSSSQWNGAVKDELQEYMGKEYTLDYNDEHEYGTTRIVEGRR